MSNIKVPTRDQVSQDSQVIFDQLQKGLGKVPNLYATIGYSSNALKALLGLEEQLNKGVFTVTEKEAINLVVSEVNNCDYCLAAHTLIAGMKGISKEETLNFRRGSVNDPKLNAVLQLAKSVAENKGKADPDKVEDFLAAGYDNAAVMELIGFVILRSFTNYVYALTEVPVDFPAVEKLA
ncbi:carboxymuconolactone decarboxylase family protein [Flavobacterium cerinum]|uniref:Carboxymuconolactone decarboxylase family protein n=1 Tax=Flavobacterium cerinum TaxID=2502784 RepID=A0ABY5IRQ9_9FLAO|nr:carboxymuconolactone decarboxylase family protein [Flavobacterium cerinum]UUC44237.1 carboxymuconolactone decarboxylase family protein [Flavobacterium cerinum]